MIKKPILLRNKKNLTYSKPTYYLDSVNGADSNTGLTAAQAWKTISKLNEVFSSGTFNAGDKIGFKSGCTFFGTIAVTDQGDQLNPITLCAYGLGSKPVITGLQDVTVWTNEGGGIYSKSVLTESNPTFLLIDGVNYAMGRYPKAGNYLTVKSHNTTLSITDTALNSAVTNWSGADMIIRKNGYMLDKCRITAHNGDTLTYTNLTSNQEPTDFYYYFIQNDKRTLTIFGEWFYGAGKLYVYFGGQNPNNYTVKIPVIDKLIHNDWGLLYTNIEGLALYGCNTNAVHLVVSGASELGNIKNCNISYCGENGIYSLGAFGEISGNNISDVNQTGIVVLRWNNKIINNVIFNCGIMEGAGISGSKCNAIEISEHDNLVQFNTIFNTGYHGILFGGAQTKIKNNYISNFLLTLTDGGGIYTTSGNVAGREIIGNVILGGVGKAPIPGETTTEAMGIYCDSYTNDTIISSNTIANCSGKGIMISNNDGTQITGNITYNNSAGLYALEWETGALKNISINNNIFIAKNNLQVPVELQSNTSIIIPFGMANNNIYSRPINENVSVYSFEFLLDSNTWKLRTLPQWKAYSLQDAATKGAPFIVNSENCILFDYNATQSPKTVKVEGSWKSLDNVVVTSYTLQPYTSILLLTTDLL